MPLLRRLSAIDQAEQALEKAVRGGEWGGLLPSYHNLCRLLKMSPPTVAKAVKRLVKRGLLIPRGKRQRFRIAASRARGARRGPGSAAGGARHRQLLILSPNRQEDWGAWQRRVVLESLQSAVADGWECNQATVDFIRARKPLKRWDNLLLVHPATHLLVMQGTRTLANWARSHDLKVAFVGGHLMQEEGCVSLGIQLADILGHCARTLHAKGHRRILMPYWGEMNGFLRFAARHIARETGADADRLLAEGWVFGAPHGTPADHRRRLAREMQRLRPTAIIAYGWHDYMVAAQCAEAAGLRVPRDLSLVALNTSPEAAWALPRPAHYKIDPAHLIRDIRDWRNGKPVGPEAATRAVLDGWVEGETLGPAPGES